MAGYWPLVITFLVVIVAVHIDRTEQIDELGCFTRLKPGQGDQPDLKTYKHDHLGTHVSCIHFCQQRGYPWALLTYAMDNNVSTQGYSSCSCSHLAYDKDTVVPEASEKCNATCSLVSDGREICGGVGYYTVLHALMALGCSTANDQHRSIPMNAFGGKKEMLTRAVCASKCQVLGFKYAGVQDGSYCYCGNGNHTVQMFMEDDSNCNVTCLGSGDKCGGKNQYTVLIALHKNECLEVTCANGGTCIDKVNDYECKCKDGTYGRRCEKESEMSSRGSRLQPLSTLDAIYTMLVVFGSYLRQ